MDLELGAENHSQASIRQMNRQTQKPFPKSLSESPTAPRSCLKQAWSLNMTNGETVMKMRDPRTGDDVSTKEIEDEGKSLVR